jgi:hypothetical protein
MPTFVSPLGGLVALAGIVPLAALLVGRRRAAAVRRVLGLPPVREGRLAPATLVAASLLVGLACAQPVLQHDVSRSARSQTELWVVLDTSRSMLASSGPGAPTRFDSAVAFAGKLRSRVRSVPFGLASFTDRVLPHLFPTLDDQVYATTLRDVMRVDAPPPAEEGAQATWYGALSALARGNFFEQQTTHRVAVLLTDGESRRFSAETLRRALYRGTPTDLIVVGTGSRSQLVYDGARSESQYRPDPGAPASLRELAATTSSRAYRVGEVDPVAARVEQLVGGAPRRPVAAGQDAFALAPYALLMAALVAALPLLLRGRTFQRPSFGVKSPIHRSQNVEHRTSTAREVS